MKNVSFNNAVDFEVSEDFFDFIASLFSFLFEVIFALLYVFDSVNDIKTFKENDVAVGGAFLHGVNFASKECDKFIVVIATVDYDFFVTSVGGVKQSNGSGGDLSFSFCVLVKNRTKAKFKNFGSGFFFDNVLTVLNGFDATTSDYLNR